MTMTVTRPNIQLKATLDNLYFRFVRLLAAAKAAQKRRAKYHATLSELRSCSDRELADLAIPRSHIRSRALEELQKRPVE